jgi:signal recognition particle receptor subunit beta
MILKLLLSFVVAAFVVVAAAVVVIAHENLNIVGCLRISWFAPLLVGINK